MANSNERIVNGIKTRLLHGKDYVEVAERVRQVHDQKRAFEVVESEPYTLGDRTLWKVIILVDEKKYKGNAEVKLSAKSGPDSTNPFECAETSALGRALAFAGLGTVESIASFDEVARALIAQDNQANAEQNNTEQASVTPLPTFKQMFAAGKIAGLWTNSAGFYKYASDLLKITVDGGVTLTHEQRVQLAQAIETANEPVAQAS